MMSRAATGTERIHLERDLERVDEDIVYWKAVLGKHDTCVVILICIQKILEGGNNCQKCIY